MLNPVDNKTQRQFSGQFETDYIYSGGTIQCVKNISNFKVYPIHLLFKYSYISLYLACPPYNHEEKDYFHYNWEREEEETLREVSVTKYGFFFVR